MNEYNIITVGHGIILIAVCTGGRINCVRRLFFEINFEGENFLLLRNRTWDPLPPGSNRDRVTTALRHIS